MKTQAALLVETGKPLVIAEIEIPPLKTGQVLVEIAFSGACGTQLMEIDGAKGENRWLPHGLGHEGSGAVLEIGPGVTRVAPGDSVVLSWLKGEGLEAGGATYDWNGRRVNAGGVTTFQRHAVVSENRLTLRPEGLDLRQAVLLGCAAPTGMGAVVNVLRAQAGDSVAVFGLGGIGLHAVIAAAVAGCDPIIGVDPHLSRRSLARGFGATHSLDPAHEDVAAQCAAIRPGGLDLAVEATGHPAVMAQALDAVRAQGGRAVVIGNAPYGAQLTLSPSVFNQGKSLMGTWGGDSRPERDYAAFAEVLGNTRFPVADLLSAPYPLEGINEALADFRAGRVARPLIDMSA